MTKNIKQQPTIDSSEGGYYALKGFTYQFDKSLIEVLNNSDKNIEVEQTQDIGLSTHYIQVKHKESQTYSPSKIRKAMVQLLKNFIADKQNSFELYCYFRDKAPESKSLTLVELDIILSAEKNTFEQKDKQDFINKFTLIFSENFEEQFKLLISKIKSDFRLKNEEQAIEYHARFRAYLLEIATKKNKKKRTINLDQLKKVANQNEKIIFDFAYCKFLKERRYFSYLKKEYFTFKKLNIANKERLFVIEVDDFVSDGDILQIITNIQSKYFKKHSSPAPYICLSGNITNERIIVIKQKLWDKSMFFVDGTHFDGDKFRINDLMVNTHDNDSNIKYKLVSIECLHLLLKNQIDEVYAFLINGDGSWDKSAIRFNEFYVNRTKNITKIIE